MAEERSAWAPYNFVPFSNRVLPRYASVEELPHHDCLYPSLKSGEIHVTMTADTPVFISDGKQGKPHFFRSPNGKYAIPGSSIRGMVRENMQILGFGCVQPGEDFEDSKIFFRELAAGRKSTGIALTEYYKSAPGVKSVRRPNGRPVSVPQNVRAGYLRREKDGYFIQPVVGTYYRVSRKHPDVRRIGDAPARVVPIVYSVSGNKITHLRSSHLSAPGMERGNLLFTGKPMRPDQPNSLYVFPRADESAIPEEIPNEDVLLYKEDWENRRTSLCNPQFWDLPDEGEEKPVFYITYEGHIYFGMSLYVRIAHRHFLSARLPKSHLEHAQSKAPVLDYPHAVLGFSKDDCSYRSRVSFGDLEVVGTAEEGAPIQKLLASPKPSYYPGYVLKGKNYSDDDFQLRGYKQYWLKEANMLSVEKKQRLSNPKDGEAEESEMGVMLRPLPKGTRFNGIIRFKNLHEDELGLLLWCLQLDKGCFQSMGLGKPYGFGRMKLQIDRLLETDYAALYDTENLCRDAARDRTNDVARYMNCYDSYAAKKLDIRDRYDRPTIRYCGEIRDFIYMRRSKKSDYEAGYMNFEDYRKVNRGLPRVADIRKAEVGKPGKKGPYSSGRISAACEKREECSN